jgi:pyruvate dehydrogenase E2 component (dihydrolipoamide acetyltransferase)
MAQHIRMPRLSQDMAQGRIVQWLKQEGEPVKEGEPLLAVETDKAEIEVQACEDGSGGRGGHTTGDSGRGR